MKNFYPLSCEMFKLQKYAGFIAVLIFVLGLVPLSGKSQTINVTTPNDVVNAGDGLISLREAIIDANAAGAGSTVTINLPAGTYTLSIAGADNTAAAGDLDVNHTAAGTKTVNIVGSGAATTTITGTVGERAFDVHSLTAAGAFLTFSVDGVTFSNINAINSGAAILAGREGDNTTITNCVFTNNTASTIGGAISQSSSLAAHNLTISNCTFTNNTASGATGGAVNYNGLGNVIITGSNFTGNTAGTTGGAINITGGGIGANSSNITENTFSGNTANGATFGGAAIAVGNAVSININYNRIIGNNAPNVAIGKVISTAGGSVGAMNNNNNWWGVNEGPSGSDILGTAASNWLQLKASSSLASICPAGTAVITAGFLSNSAGSAIAATDLGAIIGLPVSFNAALGNLTSAQTTIQSNGTATVTFTATGNGTGSVNAVVDNVSNNDATAKAAINITSPVISSVEKTDPTCAAPAGGEIIVNATGAATLEYSINGGTTWFTTSTFSGLSAGNYTVWVRSSSNPLCVTVYSSNPVVLNAPTGCVTPGITLTAEGPTGTVCGETVSVTVKVKGFTDIGTLDFSVNWDDTKLQYLSHTALEIDGSAPLNGPALPITNALTYTWFDATSDNGDYGSTLADGTTILTLNFTVLSNTASGITVNITGTPTALNASDLNFEEITVTPENLVSFDVQKVLMSAPTVTQPTCATPTGTIVVNATGPGTLEYSIDGGNTWSPNNTFAGQASGSYTIKARVVSSSPSCEASYSGNPVILNAATGCVVPTLSINDVTLNEGNSGTTTFTFTVNLSSPAGAGGVTFDIATADGTAQDDNPGSEDNDYVAKSLTSQTIPAGSSTYTFDVTVNGDVIFEPNETFFVNVTNVVGATVSDGQGQGTITNDDVAVCDITGTLFDNISSCNNNGTPGNPADDYYTADLTVNFVNAPATGTLRIEPGNPNVLDVVEIAVGSLVGNSHKFTGVRLRTTGATFAVEVEFSANNACVITTTAPAVSSCSPDVCSITTASFSNIGSCNNNGTPADPSDDYYTADLTINFANAPATGTLRIEPGNPNVLDVVEIAVGSLVGNSHVFTGVRLRTTGATFAVEVEFSADNACVRTTSAPAVSSCAVICTAPDITAPTVTQPTCALATGSIVVNATGGGTLEYSINGGTSWFSTNTFSGLAPGNYNIAVRLESNPTCFSTYNGNPIVLTAATNCCVLTCPANITVSNSPGICGANVTYPAASATPGCGVISYSKASGSLFPIGTTTVTVNSTSGQSCSFTVTVNDTEAPVITTKSQPIIMLWSPDHKYQTITVAQIVTGVTDNCGGVTVNNVRITKVTSDEAENAPGNGDGNTTKDIKIAGNCKSVDLRRERQGSGNGRVYTIHLAVTDASSNTATKTYKVYVPRDQSGKNAIDNGAVYTVNSSCGSNTRTMESAAPAMPDGFALEQNIPNPFSSSTMIRYSVPEETKVSLAVFNNVGQKVAQLVDARVTAGYHQVRFESSKLAAGIYLYRLESVDSEGNRIMVVKKMVIAK